MRKRALYLRYFGSNFLLTVLAFLAIGGLILPQYAERERKEQLRYAQMALDRQAERLEQMVLESENVLYSILQMPEFFAVNGLEPPYDRTDIAVLRDLTQTMALFGVVQSGFAEITLYLARHDLFLEGGTAGADSEVFYASRYDSSVKSYEQWRQEVLSMNGVHIGILHSLVSQQDKFVLYNTHDLVDGETVIFLGEFNENPYTLEIYNNALYDQSVFVVTDDTGSIVYSNSSTMEHSEVQSLKELTDGSTVTLDGRNYTLLRPSQSVTPWMCTWLLSDAVVDQSVNNTLTVLILTAGLLLLAMAAMAAFLAYRNSRPIYALIRKVSDSGQIDSAEIANELEYLDRRFSRILDENTDLQKEMQTQTELLKSLFFIKLLNGVVISQEELLAVSPNLGNFFSYNRYGLIVFAFRPNQSNSQKVVYYTLRRILRDSAPGDSYVTHMGGSRFAVVLALEDDGRRTAEKMTHAIGRELPDDASLDFTCVAGDCCELPEQLSREYLRISFVLDSIVQDNLAYRNDVLCVGEMKLTAKGYYYPLFEEQSLMNCFLSRRYDEAEGLLRKIFQQNFEDQQIPSRERAFFVNHLCSTFSRLLRSSHAFRRQTERYIEDTIYRIKHLEDGQDIWKQLTDLIEYLRRNEAAEEEDRGTAIYKNIERIICDCYQDVDFSIAELSRRMKLSENYLSVIYRQYAGCSIAATVERRRMEYAGTLLRESDQYIKDVCVNCGYANLNTFYKAFKRFYGITPSDYRSLRQGTPTGENNQV